MFERAVVVRLPDQGRDRLQAGPTGGAPATLPRNELIAVIGRTDEHRLEEADLTNRVRQLPE